MKSFDVQVKQHNQVLNSEKESSWSFSQRDDPGWTCIPSDGENHLTAWHPTNRAQSPKWNCTGQLQAMLSKE